jgi:hypothetical protein
MNGYLSIYRLKCSIPSRSRKIVQLRVLSKGIVLTFEMSAAGDSLFNPLPIHVRFERSY